MGISSIYPERHGAGTFSVMKSARANENEVVRAALEKKFLLGVVHLRPLPGSPRYTGESLDALAAAARADAEAILSSGFDGYIVENFGDAPFFKGAVPPHVLTLMTRIVLSLPRDGKIVGVNVLRNDARGALAVSAACGLQLIRVNVHAGAMVTDQGIIEGRAALTLRERRCIAPKLAIFADIDVKHATPLGTGFDLAEAAKETARRGLADALIVTGRATGSPASLADVRTARDAVPGVPIFVGSGVTRDSVREILRAAHGVIIGTALKLGENVEAPVDPARARDIAVEARK